MPKRVFSGKSPDSGQRAGLFCAFRFPPIQPETGNGNSAGAGELRWYFRDAMSGQILEGVEPIHTRIRTEYGTVRQLSQTWEMRNAARKEIESHVRQTAVKALQAPAGYKPVLVCWMEVG